MSKLHHFYVLVLTCLVFFGTAFAAPVAMVSSIEIDGLKRTQEATVLRELPFTVGTMWQGDFANHAERRLRNLGIFSEAFVYAPNASGVVKIHVKERWSLWLLPQATRKDNGASSAAVVMDEYNLWGLNHHVSLGYRQDTGKNFSGGNGSSYDATYDWRRLLDSKLTMSMSGSWGRSLFDTYNRGMASAQYMHTGKSGAVIFSYALGEVPNEGWGLLAGFSGSNSAYRFISGTPQADVIGNRIRTVLAGVNYTQIDDHLTWLSGHAFEYSLSASHKSIGSTINSYSQRASWRKYQVLSGDSTLNLRLNTGLMSGDVSRSGVYDIGNSKGIRGYYPGELQGSQYLYGTVEGRMPITQGSNFQLVGFTDMGMIGGTVGTSVTRGLAAGAGGGFRWTLRWLINGTIRGDVAYGFASKRPRFYLGTGQAF